MKKIFEYTQNNSGGTFEVDDKLCHRLFIEANDRAEAEEIALELGVYFNGCENGMDCDCCGDRWSEYADEIDHEELFNDGREVSIYSFVNDATVETWHSKYGEYKIIAEPVKHKHNVSGKIAFRSIEEYAQYLANEYGWTSPDARFYYLDGSVSEIYKKGDPKI